MATIKAFTSLEQSRKLAEILPLESADMLWEQHGAEPYVTIKPWTTIGKSIGCHCLSCWSLASLLGVLPEYNHQKTDWGNKTEYKIVVTINEDNYASKNYDNPLDACVAMIEKLHELKML